MPPPTKSRIFFDENTVITEEKWRLDRIAKAASQLLPPDPSYNIFIKLDHFMDSHSFFLVTLASAPNLPLEVWEATVIDEDISPQFRCVSQKE